MGLHCAVPYQWHTIYMARRNKTGGGRGTNQYRVRGRSGEQPPISTPAMRDPKDQLGNAQPVAAGLPITRDIRARRREAWDSHAQPEVLDQLTDSVDHIVRHGVAGNPSAPPAALNRLAGDVIHRIRYQVAENASTPPSALARLAEDADPVVRRSAATHPNTPIGALTRLSKDPAVPVRLAVANNPNTPPHIRALLSGFME